jgi:hypothetical protein
MNAAAKNTTETVLAVALRAHPPMFDIEAKSSPAIPRDP